MTKKRIVRTFVKLISLIARKNSEEKKLGRKKKHHYRSGSRLSDAIRYCDATC
jgi:hypothetical protein